MRKLLSLMMVLLLLAPAAVMATTVDELKAEMDALTDRLEKAERKVATDRISWYGDLRVKADTLRYKDLTYNPGILVDYDDFAAKAMSPTNAFGFMTQLTDAGGNDLTFDNAKYPGLDAMFGGNALTPLTKMMIANPNLATAFGMGLLSGVGPMGFAMAPAKDDLNNDILYTTRLRLGMKADVWDNVNFSGRLNMYKNWGDSTGVKVFDSWSSFTMDGTNSGNTTGDIVHVERAYFDWKDIADSNFYLSIGRRPSTYGPPTQYRENEQRGGTPTGHLVNFNFDGVTIGYHLSDLTGIEGQTLRFCYGQGYESEYGNGELFNSIDVEDVHLGGLNFDALNDGTNFLQLTMFRAQNVSDGFKGLIGFPNQFAPVFAPTLNADLQKFPTFNFVTRVQPSANIGNINLAGIGFTREEENGINWFTSFGWTQTDPNGDAGMFGGLLSDAVFEATLNEAQDEIIMSAARAENTEKRDGYSVYVGMQIPAPMGKLGLEYNYGSQYWIPFTQAQDDIAGSKLATRGHVGEIYYIFDVNPKMFIKVGGLYYDYEYTNSGSPVGAPQKVSDVQAGTAFSMLPVVDTITNGYASLTVKF